MSNHLKIAIVYDWLDKWGGVERVLLEFKHLFPSADFYTSYQNLEKAPWAKNLQAKTSFIQKLPNFIKKRRIFSLPFYPYAFETFDFSNYQLVISVSSSFAKSIITKPNTRHICYLLTPTRYFWFQKDLYFKNKILNFFVTPYLNSLKKWDLIVSKRPDVLISISSAVAKRTNKYYQRDSQIIYPPFDIDYWSSIKHQISKIKNINKKLKRTQSKKFFLVVSRLEPYKKVDLVIKIFNQKSNLNLVIVGQGSEEKKLKHDAKKNITFISYVSDSELAQLYASAETLIMPQEEDFGYVSLESQFFGCPVIAYRKGGAEETVLENTTGLFFNDQNQESLAAALERFNKLSYNLKQSTKVNGPKQGQKFNRVNFENKLLDLVKN